MTAGPNSKIEGSEIEIDKIRNSGKVISFPRKLDPIVTSMLGRKEEIE